MFKLEAILDRSSNAADLAKKMISKKGLTRKKAFNNFSKIKEIPEYTYRTNEYAVLKFGVMACSTVGLVGLFAILPSFGVCLGIKTYGFKMLIISLSLVAGSFGLIFVSLISTSIARLLLDDYKHGNLTEEELIEILNKIREYKGIQDKKSL